VCKRAGAQNVDILRDRYICHAPKDVFDRSALKVQNEIPNDFEEWVPLTDENRLQIRPRQCERIQLPNSSRQEKRRKCRAAAKRIAFNVSKKSMR
jgi:hypothetical protein